MVPRTSAGVNRYDHGLGGRYGGGKHVCAARKRRPLSRPAGPGLSTLSRA